MANEPIVVDDTPLVAQAWSALRQIVPPIVAFAAGRHWLDNDTVTMLGAVGVAVWALVAGQFKIRQRGQQMATMAAAAPDDVAMLKSEVQ